MPGVRAAAVTDSLPLSGDDNRTGVNLEGRVQQPGELWRLSPRLVTPGYLATMGIALERGRSFTEAEAVGERRVAVISATAARQLWRGEDPIGRRFAFFSPENPMYEIVGIAAPVHHRGLDRESVPEVYVPLRQNPFLFPPNSVKLVLRTTRAGTEGSGGPTAADLRTVIRALDPALPVSKLRQMETYLSDSVAPHRFNLVVLSIFAAVALALAAAGLYGLIGFLAAQRTTEIGIRMALGARQSDVLLTIMAQGMRLALAGVAVGAGCSWAAARMISKLLFGVTAHDPAIFLFAPIVLMAITSIASYVPGRRAARADPVTALRAS
jgi:putative ABC transport system permease protein